MKTIPMSQLYSFQPTYQLLEMFMALPETVGAIDARRDSTDSVSFLVSTPEGDTLDWNAVVGDSLDKFLEALRRWMRFSEEGYTSARFYRDRENAVFIYTYYPYKAIHEEKRQIVYRADVPLPKPVKVNFIRYNTHPLRERVEYAVWRYPVFWRNEAPKIFRETYSEQPTIEAVLEMGRIKGYWHRREAPVAERFLRELVPAEAGNLGE